VVRRNEDGKLYQNPRAPTQPEKLLYRLSTLPGAPPQRSARHALTDAHYTLAGTVFGAAYRFFASEFSHRDALLGPLPPPPPGGSAAVITALTNAALDDTNGPGAAPIEPGTIGGFVLHPDYPEPDRPAGGGSRGPRRETHRNHIHANLGNRVGQPDSES